VRLPQLFNLGKGNPDYVNELIEILEKDLRIKAKRYALGPASSTARLAGGWPKAF
jgi:hypothetical protein